MDAGGGKSAPPFSMVPANAGLLLLQPIEPCSQRERARRHRGERSLQLSCFGAEMMPGIANVWAATGSLFRIPLFASTASSAAT